MRDQPLPRLDLAGAPHDPARSVGGHGESTLEDGHRSHRLQGPIEGFEAIASTGHVVLHAPRQTEFAPIQSGPGRIQSTPRAGAEGLGHGLQSRSTLLEQDIRTTGGQFGGMPLQSRAAHLHSEFDGTAQPLARACDAIRLPPDPLSGQQSQPCRPVVELLAKFVRVRQEVPTAWSAWTPCDPRPVR